ncbi:MAG: hypothetical protein AAFR81_11775 [Chloroflexota bacterium]
MQMTRNSWHLTLVLALALVIVACTSSATSTVEASNNNDNVEGDPEAFVLSQDVGPVGEAIPGLADGQRLLAWIAPASAPGEQPSNTPGELVFFNPDGSTETILALPERTRDVIACGPNATSPDGSTFVFAVVTVDDRANVYMMQGSSSDLITLLTDVNPAVCFGSTPFAFSADGSQMAFVEWPLDATEMTSPFGFLRIFDVASGSETNTFENVTTFQWTASGATWVSFFPNDQGEATEVAITTWDGTVDIEVSALVGDEENDCYYNSASIDEVSTGLMAIMGYRCNLGDVTSTQWQIYNIDPANRTAQLELTDVASGRYFFFTDTNAIFPSPDGSTVLFTLPDGVTTQTAALFSTAVDTIEPTELINRSAVMPSVSDTPYDANNATAQVSPDGRYLAVVVNTPNNDATLNIYDLSDASVPPIVMDAGDSGDTIADFVFDTANERMFFVAGTDEGGNNSLFSLDLNTGTEQRIRRGRYAQMVASPDGSTVAIMNWVEFDAEEPLYLTLEVIDVESTVPTVIYVGGTVDEEGDLAEQAFAYPLAWR